MNEKKEYNTDFIIKLKSVISEFENKTQFDTHEIFNEIYKICDSCPEDIKNKELWWEKFAISWYRPAVPKNKSENSFWEQLNEENPELPFYYWKLRINEVQNPLLKLQYSGLCWEYAKKEKSLKADQSFAQSAIDSIIEITKKNMCKFHVNNIGLLEWALETSINIHDGQRIEKLRDIIVIFEEQIAQDHLCGLWGFSYDLLIDNKKIKDKITDELEKNIITGLEQRLERLKNAPKDKSTENERAAEMAATRLADYYKKKNLLVNLKNVLQKYAIVVQNIDDNSAMKIAHFLLKLFHILKSYDYHELADTIAVKLREIEKETIKEFGKIETPFEISKEEMDSFLDEFTQNGLDKSIMNIITHYIPDIDNYYKDLEEKANIFPGVYRLFSKSIVDHKGRTVSIIYPFTDSKEENDINIRWKKNEGQLFNYISQNMSLVMPIFFREIINRLIDKEGLTIEWILSFLFKSPVFEPEKRNVIECGLKLYFDKNFIASIHILIPQVEEALRNLIELNGFNVYKKTRNGGLILKTFDDLLEDIIENQILPDDVSFYFRILYTDPRGWNLRNQICHGFYPAGLLNYSVADRIFHSLLCLALIKKTDT